MRVPFFLSGGDVHGAADAALGGDTMLQMLRTVVQNTKRLARSVAGKERFYRAEVRCPRVVLGNRNACFAVNPTRLNEHSVIYSFGIGSDISFDAACIRRFGAQVHAFDPTPRSLVWLETQTLPAGLHVHAYGVAHFDGAITLYPPANPAHVSYSVTERGGEAVECPVFRLSSIMRQLGHEQLDVLKMDIEGGEYDVLDDMLAAAIPVTQICVEFHHRWPEIGRHKTDLAIERLRSRGYRIFHVSPSGEEFSLIRTQ